MNNKHEADPVAEIIKQMRNEGYSPTHIAKCMAQAGFELPNMEEYIERISSPIN